MEKKLNWIKDIVKVFPSQHRKRLVHRAVSFYNRSDETLEAPVSFNFKLFTVPNLRYQLS